MNKIICGDALKELKKLPENSVDAIITDPPYGLEFMGKDWDKFGVTEARAKRLTQTEPKTGDPKYDYLVGKGRYSEMSLSEIGAMQKFFFEWATECLRVLKSGGYLLSFGGTRTYHRMTCGIEDAGFEIRDTIMWLYGSGFPKSLNIGKQIDKRGGKYVDWKEFQKYLKKAKIESVYSNKELDKMLGFSVKGGGMFDHFINPAQAQLPRAKTYKQIKEILKLDDTYDDLIKEAEREITGKDGRGEIKEDMFFHKGGEVDKAIGYGKWDLKNKPATPEAKEWEGWGTALKPACEPIVVARKPLSEKNVALNVLKHGTGGMNIDTCRIECDSILDKSQDRTMIQRANGKEQGWGMKPQGKTQVLDLKKGRFPANIILDEEAGKMLDEQSGVGGDKKEGLNKVGQKGVFSGNIYGKDYGHKIETKRRIVDKGGASRFFYCAKASKSERNFGLDDKQPIRYDDKKTDDGREVVSDRPHQRGETQRKNNHPTVKPIKLMEYLIKLVSREGAIILDPFIGSGTTAIACIKLNRKYIGIEKEEEYVKIAQARIKPFLEQKKL